MISIKNTAPAMRLKDRLAVVTGASRGIGFAIARKFAMEGAHVIICARTIGGLEELDDLIKQDGIGKSTIAKLDLCDFATIDAMGASIFKRFGKLDILIGNAGSLGELSPISHISPKLWDDTFAINVTANYRLIRSFDALLRQSNAGRAIFTSSGAVKNNRPYWGVYSASKAALEGLVKSYAGEITKTNVKANIVDPGVIATSMRAKAYPGEDQNKLLKPEDISDIFVKLAMADYMENGQVIKAQ